MLPLNFNHPHFYHSHSMTPLLKSIPLSLSLSSAHFLTLSHKNRIKLCTKSPSLGNLQSQQQWMAMPTNKNKQISKVQTLPQRYILYLYIVNNLQDSSQKNSFFFSFLKTLQKISRILDNFSLLPPLLFFLHLLIRASFVIIYPQAVI